MRIFFYFVICATSTLLFKNPIIGLFLAFLGTIYTNTPIEVFCAISGTALASILKDCTPRQQVNYTVLGCVLYMLALRYTATLTHDLLAGFCIVLAIRGCLLWK